MSIKHFSGSLLHFSSIACIWLLGISDIAIANFHHLCGILLTTILRNIARSGISSCFGLIVGDSVGTSGMD